MTIYIFPKILPVLLGLKAELPWSTKGLIFLSNLFVNYGFVSVIGIIGLIILTWLILKIEKVRFRVHQVILYLPLVGGLSQNYNMANFCRTLGLLLKSDIKIVEALSITADTTNNLVYRQELRHISGDISKGEEISRHLEKNNHLFPIMLSQLVSIGETTGNLTDTLLYLSEFYENRFDETIKNLSIVLEPFLMIIMGTIVGFVAISIITPIYEITQNIRH
ncbi:type II secretion system F family protein [Candidatus Azambacteria bacterium]|nr:type II secretion system F family protein [Candidatus Azambacteria bacterium]